MIEDDARLTTITFTATQFASIRTWSTDQCFLLGVFAHTPAIHAPLLAFRITSTSRLDVMSLAKTVRVRLGRTTRLRALLTFPRNDTP
jgi:hypothetical protein